MISAISRLLSRERPRRLAVLAAALRDLLSDRASHWRRQKQRLALHARPAASRVAASFVLELAAKARSSPVAD